MNEQPISNVTWVHRDTLIPNDYNPNKVAPPEMKLLKISILEDGWTQPIVALKGCNHIVDGFHRWTVSGHKELLEKFKGMVPVVFIEADPVHKKMSTIRHNRARGTHGVLPMANIVRSMLEDGISQKEIERRLQMEDEEVERLTDRSGMPGRASQQGFNPSWKT